MPYIQNFSQTAILDIKKHIQKHLHKLLDLHDTIPTCRNGIMQVIYNIFTHQNTINEVNYYMLMILIYLVKSIVKIKDSKVLYINLLSNCAQ